MTCDAIRAKKKGRAVFDLNGLHIHLNRSFGAKSAADNILAGVIGGLFSSHATSTNFFLNNRMVFSFAIEVTVGSYAIEPGIADVAECRPAFVHVQRHNRCGHH